MPKSPGIFDEEASVNVTLNLELYLLTISLNTRDLLHCEAILSSSIL